MLLGIFDRTELLIGSSSLEKLKNSHIAVFGVGGVGGYVVEFLARAGVGTITIVDFDNVDITNINRQIIANTNTIGRPKVEVLKERILTINPDCVVLCKQEKYDLNTRESLLSSDYDMIVDAIDMVTSKIDLIVSSIERNISIISAMGAGNKYSIPSFQITDIYKTSNDGLAKVLRKKLRENGIAHHTVAYSNQDVDLKGSDIIGSISYFPPALASVISGYVVNKIINGDN